jgi:hypothetical protein
MGRHGIDDVLLCDGSYFLVIPCCLSNDMQETLVEDGAFLDGN